MSNYFDGIVQFITANQTDFQFGELKVHVTSETTKGEINGRKIVISNAPVKPRSLYAVQVDYQEVFGDGLESIAIPVQRGASIHIATEMGLNDSGPIDEMFALVTRNIRRKTGALVFAHETGMGPSFMSIVDPREAPGVGTITFKQSSGYRPLVSDPRSPGAYTDLDLVQECDPNLLAQIKDEAAQIQEAFQNGSAFGPRNVCRLVPRRDTPGHAWVYLDGDQLGLEIILAGEEKHFMFTLPHGQKVLCVPDVLATREVCRALGYISAEKAMALSKMLSHVELYGV